MAIERNNYGTTLNAAAAAAAVASADPENLNRLKLVLEQLADFELEESTDEKHIQDECNRVVRELVNISVPKSASYIKEFQNHLNSVGQTLERIIRQSPNPEQIFISCLQTLYCLLVSHDSPSPGSGIIFDIYDQNSIPKAIKLLIKNTSDMGVDNDNDFKKVTERLCVWLRTFSGLKNLSHCIIYFLDGLRDLRKYALLMEIAESVIDGLFLSLIIPVVRPNTVKVLSHILCSAQSRALFLKIVPRIPRALQSILSVAQDSAIPSDIQLSIDLISTFCSKYGIYDSEISNILKDYKVSEMAESLLDVKPWHPPISKRDPSMPIGLVNLGNTCYMNSVLQALFMTKELTHDILLMKLPSKIINYIQQLISLLLFSLRQEVAPHDVLGQRPSSFRYGHQQDSFEYLGYLLDQLHEEERRCLINAAKSMDYTNNQILNGNNTQQKLQNRNGNDNGNTIGNGNDNGDNGNDMAAGTEQMDIDDNNQLEQTISMDSPPLTDDSDDAINPISMHGICGNESQKTLSKTTKIVNTMIQKLFGGRLSINYKCLNCNTQSTNIDNFFDLQLSFLSPLPQNQLNGGKMDSSSTAAAVSTPLPPLVDKTHYTTQSLLNSYFATEEMINDDRYYCDKCKALCDGERHITLEEGPSNLILVIKHFKYDRNCHVRRKLLHKVHHDEQITLMARSTDGAYVRLKYKLYAVIVHCGMNIDSGHYYTYAVNNADEWFKFNDSHISRSSFSDIKNLSTLNTPYILFYELMHKEQLTIDGNDAVNGIAPVKIHSEPVTNLVTTVAVNVNAAAAAVTAAAAATTETCRKRKAAEPPRWDDLPPKLQEFVNRDNHIYTDQYRKQYLNGNSETVKNFYNKHRKSDNDQDPPSPCGGSIVEPSNYSIY